MPRCLIGLGANLGNPVAALTAAAQQLSQLGDISRLAVSSLYETTPIGGPPDQPAFLNAAATCDTLLAPGDLLQRLQQLETAAGRKRELRWSARPLDLDLLLYGEAQWNEPTLIVPHPRMAFRRFVLEPAAEIAADMIHPACGLSLATLLRRLIVDPICVALAGATPQVRQRLAQEVCAPSSAIHVSAMTDEVALQSTDENQAETPCVFFLDYVPDANDLRLTRLRNPREESQLTLPTLIVALDRAECASAGAPVFHLATEPWETAVEELVAMTAAITDRPRRRPADDIWPPRLDTPGPCAGPC